MFELLLHLVELEEGEFGFFSGFAELGLGLQELLAAGRSVGLGLGRGELAFELSHLLLGLGQLLLGLPGLQQQRGPGAGVGALQRQAEFGLAAEQIGLAFEVGVAVEHVGAPLKVELQHQGQCTCWILLDPRIFLRTVSVSGISVTIAVVIEQEAEAGCVEMAEVDQAAARRRQLTGFQEDGGVLEPGVEEVFEGTGLAGLLLQQQSDRADITQPAAPGFGRGDLLEQLVWPEPFGAQGLHRLGPGRTHAGHQPHLQREDWAAHGVDWGQGRACMHGRNLRGLSRRHEQGQQPL